MSTSEMIHRLSVATLCLQKFQSHLKLIVSYIIKLSLSVCEYVGPE